MSSTKFDSDSLGTEGEKVNPEQPSIRRNKGDADETCAEKVKIIREDVMPEKSLEFQVLGNHGQAMTVAIDGSTFVGSRLPFLQQWQTDKYCQLKHLQFHPLFPSSHPSPVNELVSWLENDDRLEKVWDAEMHERSILRDYEFSDMFPRTNNYRALRANRNFGNFARGAPRGGRANELPWMSNPTDQLRISGLEKSLHQEKARRIDAEIRLETVQKQLSQVQSTYESELNFNLLYEKELEGRKKMEKELSSVKEHHAHELKELEEGFSSRESMIAKEILTLRAQSQKASEENGNLEEQCGLWRTCHLQDLQKIKELKKIIRETKEKGARCKGMLLNLCESQLPVDLEDAFVIEEEEEDDFVSKELPETQAPVEQ